ncbi:MFS transporter [Roseibium sp. SCP14]|uniref:MFS transporter n=1 Tax=Roseibium sp. SCP14 TaxID=3141375 RepID=UPI00333AF939
MFLISESNRRWWLLGGVACVLGVILLDETVVGIALPTIQKDFGLTATEAHWVVNAYLLTFACFVAIGGKLADIYGTLRVFLTGLVIFGFSSIACGFSPSGGFLIAARATQGVGAAIIFPLYVAMVGMTFAKEERGFAIAVGGSVGTTFLALGPLVGGLLTDLVSWRWIFWINPIVTVGIGLIVSLTFRDVARPPGRRIDWIGLVLIASGMFAVVFGLMEADNWGWDNPGIWAFLISGCVLLVLFCRIETGLQSPLIEVQLFSSRVFTCSNLTIFMAQYAKVMLFVFVALYAQGQLGLSPLEAGAMVMLAPILQPFAALTCGRLTRKYPYRNLALFGISGTGMCLAWLCLVAPENSLVLFAIGLPLSGIAFPFLMVPSRAAIMDALPEHKHGQGGGIAMTFQMIGGTIGLSLSSAALPLGGFQLVFGLAAALFALLLGFALLIFHGEQARQTS